MKMTRTTLAVLAVSSVALLTACSDDNKEVAAPVQPSSPVVTETAPVAPAATPTATEDKSGQG